jgi:hypothetical protein
MKRPGKFGTVLGMIALAIAIVGLSLATVSAAPQKPDKEGQGVSVHGF